VTLVFKVGSEWVHQSVFGSVKSLFDGDIREWMLSTAMFFANGICGIPRDIVHVLLVRDIRDMTASNKFHRSNTLPE
jgi:hypothetical protein